MCFYNILQYSYVLFLSHNHRIIHLYRIHIYLSSLIILLLSYTHILCQISDPFVRAYAIQQLYILDDNELADILLQLVQV